MEKEKVAKKAKEIVDVLANEGLSMKEAMDVLHEADMIIKTASGLLTKKKLKTALKDNLKAAEDYSAEESSPSE